MMWVLFPSLYKWSLEIIKNISNAIQLEYGRDSNFSMSNCKAYVPLSEISKMELKYPSEFKSLAYSWYHFLLQINFGDIFARYHLPLRLLLELGIEEFLSYFQLATDLSNKYFQPAQ